MPALSKSGVIVGFCFGFIFSLLFSARRTPLQAIAPRPSVGCSPLYEHDLRNNTFAERVGTPSSIHLNDGARTPYSKLDISKYLLHAGDPVNGVPMMAERFESMLAKDIDVIILAHFALSKRWRQTKATVPESEVLAFSKLLLPTLQSCQSCNFHLLTAFDDSVWGETAVAAFKFLNISAPGIFNADAIAKFLLYKFAQRGRLITVSTDMDDFVERHYFDELLSDIAKRNLSEPQQICYRPKEYFKFYPGVLFGNQSRVKPYSTPRALRIFLGCLAVGSYNDVIAIDHTKFHLRNHGCDEMVRLGAAGFYTQRSGSSSNYVESQLRDAYIGASPFDKVKLKLAQGIL